MDLYTILCESVIDRSAWSSSRSEVECKKKKKKNVNGEVSKERFLELFWLDLETSEMPPLTLDQCSVRFLAIFGRHTWPLYGVPWRKRSSSTTPCDQAFFTPTSRDYSHTRESRGVHGSPRSDRLKIAETRHSSFLLSPSRLVSNAIMEIQTFHEDLRFRNLLSRPSEDSGSPLESCFWKKKWTKRICIPNHL